MKQAESIICAPQVDNLVVMTQIMYNYSLPVKGDALAN